jgi:two-component system response regulator GlrR
MSSDTNSEISGGESGESFCTPVILVVEDEPLTRKAVARKLQAAGYEVVAVPSAGDALIVAQRLTFHVLVLDLNLVGEDDPFSGLHEGFAVIDWLRHQMGGIPFQIIIHTSQAQKHIMERAQAYGAFAFCPKRRDMENLLRCVNEAVESLNAAVDESAPAQDQSGANEPAQGDDRNAAA